MGDKYKINRLIYKSNNTDNISAVGINGQAISSIKGLFVMQAYNVDESFNSLPKSFDWSKLPSVINNKAIIGGMGANSYSRTFDELTGNIRVEMDIEPVRTNVYHHIELKGNNGGVAVVVINANVNGTNSNKIILQKRKDNVSENINISSTQDLQKPFKLNIFVDTNLKRFTAWAGNEIPTKLIWQDMYNCELSSAINEINFYTNSYGDPSYYLSNLKVYSVHANTMPQSVVINGINISPKETGNTLVVNLPMQISLNEFSLDKIITTVGTENSVTTIESQGEIKRFNIYVKAADLINDMQYVLEVRPFDFSVDLSENSGFILADIIIDNRKGLHKDVTALMATYNDSKLINVSLTPVYIYSDALIKAKTLISKSNGKMFKVMLFENLTALKPLASAKY